MINPNKTKPTTSAGYSRSSRMPWLRLHITNLCNFNCPGCHVFKISKNNIVATNMPYIVAEEAIVNFTNLIKKYLPQTKEFHLSIYGGEPLLNRDALYKLLKKYQTDIKGLKIHWIVNTNGSLLNEEDLNNFALGEVDIHMSVDGKEKKHNKTRKDKQGRPTFKRVMAAIDLIKKRHYPLLQFDCVANPYELDLMNEVLEVAKAKKVNRIHFDLFYSPQYPKDFSCEQYAEKYAQIYEQGKANKISIFASPFSQIYSDLILQRANERPLTQRFPILEFFADGSFIFSELPLIKPFDKLTNLEKDETWKKRMECLVELGNEMNLKCRKCYLYPYCQGELCRIYRYHTLTKENEENVCAIARETATILKNNNFIPL